MDSTTALSAPIATAESGDDHEPPSAEMDSWSDFAEYVRLLSGLPPRQAEVYALKQFGFSRSDIAEMLDISVYTVDDHLGSLKDKRVTGGWSGFFLRWLDADELALVRRGVAADTGGTPRRCVGVGVFENIADASSTAFLLVQDESVTDAGDAVAYGDSLVFTFESADALQRGAYVRRLFMDLHEQVTVLEALQAAGLDDDLEAQRMDVLSETQAAYDAVAKRDRYARDVAEEFGLPTGLVKWNARERVPQEAR